ncbi:alpha/beta hydrolase family protein [Bacillus daqingensis]|uniref:Alpha/beta hydrolase family protein n=1 Tax=Bacillus daqingensis TaxID=872396 RepID=A0ABV9NX73_9BACI
MKSSLLVLAVLLVSACSTEEVITDKQEIPDFSSDVDVNAWEITYESDGYLIDGYVVSADEEPAPTLIINRGGNRSFGEVTHDELAFFHSYWADQGYTVIASQYREGGNSEGEDEFGGDDVHDVLQLAHVAEELAFADADEIYMLGFSRGGMMTTRAIQEGMDIQAAAVVGGATDIRELYENDRPEMRPLLAELIGVPDEVPEEYEKRSAVHWAEEINAPLLLLHGEADEQVPVEQAEKLHEAMNAAGQESSLLTYEGDDHSVQENWDAAQVEILDWFERH